MRYNYLVLLISLLTLVGCSSTSQLPQGEVLYTGLKKIEVVPPEGEKRIEPAALTALKEPLEVKPNNAFFSPYIRTPFPIGLWVYNHWKPKREKGFGYWLYKKLAKEPILISGVQPAVRANAAADILNEYGYFGSKTSYEVIPNKRNPREAKVRYRVEVAPAFTYSHIVFPTVSDSITQRIDSLQASSLLRVGGQYNLDSLAAERVRIADTLRNEGYYYFRPDYLDYLADTTLQHQRVSLRMVMKEGLPQQVLRHYKTGDIELAIAAASGKGVWEQDTLPHLALSYQSPLTIKKEILERCVTLREGAPYSLAIQRETVNNLNRLGVFRYVELEATPTDSTSRSDTLAVKIRADIAPPLEAQFGVDVSSKSNSFLGPGMDFTLTANNPFGGAEVLSVKLDAAYEWQTGDKSEGSGSLLNSYEFGISTSLMLPRLLVPRFIDYSYKYPAKTTIDVGIDMMNRPSYFRIVSFNTSIDYTFRTSERSHHTFTPIKLVYSKLLNTTELFDSAMIENPAIALSFETSFIASMRYSYQYQKSIGKNVFFWQCSLSEAGNLLVGIANLLGKSGEKQLFGTPISQFVKGENTVKYYAYLGNDSWLASRLIVGAAHAYGNSTVMPYSEQFYIGGASSIRAFTIRSLGPGSYLPPSTEVDGYLDQTGTFKFEVNVEYRFPIAGRLHGATFIDAGNVWLIEADSSREGGELLAKTFLNDIALGTGFGLRYDIGMIVLRGDLGIALHTPYPNANKTTYYNISSFGSGLAFHLAIGYPF